jgi:poly(A) polymerase
VTGADLVARGILPGPAIGKLLAELEGWWIAQDFPAEQATIAQLQSLLASRDTE